MKKKPVAILLCIATVLCLSLCLTACYQVFTITFDSDGGSECQALVTEGNKQITLPEAPVKEGFVFGGWYFDKSFERAFTKDSFAHRLLTSDLTVYAKWLSATANDCFAFTLNEWDDNNSYTVSAAQGATLPEALVIPSSYNGKPVNFIDDFAKNTDIKSVYIPDSVTLIADSAFANCTNLAEIRLSVNLEDVGDSLFYNTAWSNSQPNGVVYLDHFLYEYKGAVPENYTIDIREGTTIVGTRAFAYFNNPSVNDHFTALKIPASLRKVCFNAFLQCKLTEITVDPANEYFRAVDGNLLSKDGTVFYNYALGNARESYSIPEGVVHIGDEAFAYCNNLKNIVIPDSVVSIGDGIFDCSNLETAVIGSGIQTIGDGVFHMCAALKTVTVKAAVPPTFGVYFTESFRKFYVPADSLAAYQAADGWKNAKNNLFAIEA